MPNWIVNKISIEKKESEKLILNQYLTKHDEETLFDFNLIHQMPKALKVTRGSITFRGLQLYLAAINPFIEEVIDDIDKFSKHDFVKMITEVLSMEKMDLFYWERLILDSSELKEFMRMNSDNLSSYVAFGEKIVNNKMTYGYFDWYEWSLDNWGCKWNSSNTIYDEIKDAVTFETPWTPSFPIVCKLSLKHPNYKIKYEFADEVFGNYVGEQIYYNGVVIFSKEYDKDSKEACQKSIELWNDSDKYYFDENKNKVMEK